MGLFILAREGVWYDHNMMRGPILIDNPGFKTGYPRNDYSNIKFMHDHGEWLVVYIEGAAKGFDKAFLDVEPISDITFKGFIQKAFDQSNSLDGSKRTRFCKEFIELIRAAGLFDEEISDPHPRMLEHIEKTVLNKEFSLKRVTKQEIIDRNLHP